MPPRDAAELLGRTGLPDAALLPSGIVGRSFIERGITRFRDAAAHVHQLPYGRNSDRSDYSLVLPEGRGACSTKHALIAALAAEHSVDVHLILGIYLMDTVNTPGVGAPLDRFGLDAVPEAHCFLMAGQHRIDLTWPDRLSPPPPMLVEQRIRPEQIGTFKTEWHRSFLDAWAFKSGLDQHLVWTAREACIAALSERT